MPKNKGGRPKKEIDYNKLSELCSILCTGEECANLLDLSYESLNNKLKEDGHDGFLEYYKKHSSEGKSTLRRTQFKLAKEGNVTMLIWLGKQCLGQREPDKLADFLVGDYKPDDEFL